MIPYVNHEACVSSQHCVCALLAFVSPPATSKSCVVRNLAPEATLKLRLRLELRIHITHVNIMEPISFYYNKLDCIFWLYSLGYNKDLFFNILLISLVVFIDVDYVDLNAKLQKFDSAKMLYQNVAQLLFASDELHIDSIIFCGLPMVPRSK
jgi:hypothetical protein